MDQIAAIRIFVRVVERGSFSSVAREAGVGQPAVSKQITALEAHLGAQLLRRTSRNLSLTEAGQEFYESAVRLLNDLEAAKSRVGRGQTAPSGLIRVTVAPVFGRLYIVPRLSEFFARYPEITVEAIVTDRVVNVVEEGVDLSIHNGELSNSTLVIRKIAATPIITVASHHYLREYGEPTALSELDGHRCVIYAPQGAPKPGGSRASSATSNIDRRAASGPTTLIRFAQPSCAILGWRTRPVGCLRGRSPLAMYGWCCATTNQALSQLARSTQQGVG